VSEYILWLTRRLLLKHVGSVRFLQKVSDAQQGCIYLINTVKTVILLNIVI